MRRFLRGAGAVCGACALCAGCSVGALKVVGLPTSALPTGPAAAYLAIATPANHRLDVDFDRLDGPDLSRPQAARADLRDIAATERAFDRSLADLGLPTAADGSRRLLIQANEARAALTERAVGSVGAVPLPVLRQQLRAADRPVEQQVTALRAALRLPPPATS